jgi:branched-chain amino acid transport system ATP-binding protein
LRQQERDRLDEYILRTEALSKDFIGLRAIDTLDMAVKRGDIHGFIGPNGSGKSTFFNVVSGVLDATVGKIIFDSVDITILKPHIIARMGMCRTFQAGKLAPTLTVLENVMTGAHSRTKNRMLGTFLHPPFVQIRQEKEIREMAMKSLELIGLMGRADNFAGDLVWVERQMVQIARAMVAEPKLLLMDEPTGGMGEEESIKVDTIIQRIRDEFGTTIIVVAHDMRLVTGISDVITCINFGRKICEGTPEEVQNNPDVLEAYLGEE